MSGTERLVLRSDWAGRAHRRLWRIGAQYLKASAVVLFINVTLCETLRQSHLGGARGLLAMPVGSAGSEAMREAMPLAPRAVATRKGATPPAGSDEADEADDRDDDEDPEERDQEEQEAESMRYGVEHAGQGEGRQHDGVL
jgi:hypothetical protein